jgi:hypothetical protein
MHTLVRLALAGIWILPCSRLCSAAEQDGIQFFEAKIRPVLATQCYGCHSAQAPKLQGGLALDSQSGIRKGGNSGIVIDSGQPERSVLLKAIRYQDRSLKMPPGKALPAEIVADFETWIRNGSAMPADSTPRATVPRTLWSLRPPQDLAVPKVQHADRPRNAIDQFILAKLEEKGLTLSPQADKRTLIRRITYDLSGLPPTTPEIDAFLADQSPEAYARVVDRLLASPRYGERWGRYWLDVARYSDARNVGERFPFSYTYRDWVIRALNEDMPYDRFLTLQLAADLLPHSEERRDLAALGYLSLGREFPKSVAETVDDRIDAVARGMLGLTVACARCHDHKYDPIPTKDYYSLYSIFSNIREPAELPLLHTAVHRTALDDVWEPRLERIRKIDRDYRQKRCAEMITFFKTQIADYLLAARDSRQLGNTEIEELVRDRQLNLHLLRRWRQHLADSQNHDEPVFRLWHILAAIPNAEFSARAKPAIETPTGGNARITEAFRRSPPTSIRDAANLYASVLLSHDRADKFSDSEDEALRLSLRGPNAAVNVPISEFELIYSEGDGNNIHGFEMRYETTRTDYAYLGAAPRAMAVEDVPSPVTAHVFVRGNPNNPGAETPPHFLSCLSAGDPAPFHKGSGRLELAQAITAKENPLTARVIVNRVWLHHFGTGIVRSPSDFGLRGDPPTHPELLDYLAIRFMESGWSVKKLHRLILLSATYQQSSQDNPEARRQDPENQLLWRMNRQRLDIEALRDSLLAVSGQLDPAAGGPPFSLTAIPPVPRRTLYGFIERGRVPVFLSSFDFASPDQHAPIRFSTTVPQQALFLLNSTFVAEQAKHLAQRSETEYGNPAKRIQALYQLVFGRNATPAEVELGERFIATPPQDEPPSAEASAWRYGFGEFDTSTGRAKSFTPFSYFEDAWQSAPTLPEPISGNAQLRASGGEPGEDPQHAVIRRWVSPVDGKIDIEGSLKHDQTDLPTGDGVRARIASSREGELASWVVNGTAAETKISGIPVEKGDTIDFIVDGRADNENDSFTWAPKIRLETAGKEWNAAADFRGPAARPLTVWERYAQVLLQSNEFAFVD